MPDSSGWRMPTSPSPSPRSCSIHSCSLAIGAMPSAANDAASGERAATSAHAQPRSGGWIVHVLASARLMTL